MCLDQLIKLALAHVEAQHPDCQCDLSLLARIQGGYATNDDFDTLMQLVEIFAEGEVRPSELHLFEDKLSESQSH